MEKFVNESSWNFAKIKWLDRYMSGHSGFIAGGCFKQIFAQERVKDIDVFFSNEEEWGKAAIYFRDSADYDSYYDNKKVEAYKHKKTGVVVELIKTVYGSPADIIGNFDFTITKFAYYKHTEQNENDEASVTYKCLYHPLFFEHLTFRRLVLDDKIPFPASTFERMFKYGKYGYFPCRETKLRIIEALRDMPQVPDLSLSMYDGLD